MRKKKREITEDTIYSVLTALALVYGVMVLVYTIYLILSIIKAI